MATFRFSVRCFGVVALCFGAACAGPTAITKLVDGKLIETRSISPRAYEHAARALIFEEEDRYEDAVAEFKAALEYDHDAPELWARLAEAYLELDDVVKAQAAIDQSLKLEPTVEGLVAQGHLHLSKGDAHSASAAFQRALPLVNFAETAEAAERVYLERADAQIMALLPEAAMATLESLLSGLPTSQMGLYKQAAIAWALGDFAATRRYLERLLQIEPDQLEARLLLARLLTVLEKTEAARAAYEEALSRSEGDLSVAAMYATFLLQQGLTDDAAALADRMQPSEAESGSLPLRMELERAAGRLPQAMEMADAVLATQPGPDVGGRALMAKGGLLESSHRPEEAARVFEAIAEDSPSFAEGQLRAVALRREQGQTKQAESLLRKLESDALDDTMQAELRIAKSLVLAQAGKLEEGRLLLQNSEVAAAATPRIQLAQAVLEDKYGDWKQALSFSEKVLSNDLSNAEALNFWAFVAAEQKYELPKALARAEAALAFDPGSPAIMDTLGWLHLQMNKPDSARPFLEGAAMIEPNDAEIQAHLATLYVRLGKTSQAMSRAQRALELNPSPALRTRLEAMLKGNSAVKAKSP